MTLTNQAITTGFFKRNQWRLLFIGALILISCALTWRYYDSRYPSWYEEVRLSDSRIVTIHQKREYYDNYGTNQSWVEIDLPELGGKRVWHSYLMPQRVDVVDGKVYVFGIPRGDRQLQYYRFPRYYMVAFKWNGLDFERIPFMQVPEQVRKEENIFSCIPAAKPSKLLLSSKESIWCPARGDKGQLGRFLDIPIYSRVADQWAATYNWTNRSE